jgi:hypothetical protein
MTTLVSIPYEYAVLVDDDGRHFLDACCGGIAMYIARVELLPDEIASFRADASSIEGLARRVQQHGKRPST